MACKEPGFLVIRGGAIGDFVLTLPVLAALRKHFPDRRVTILGIPRIAVLALRAGLADEICDLEDRRFTSLFVPETQNLPESPQLVLPADVVLSYLHDPGRVFEKNWARHSSSRWVQGVHRPSEFLPAHATAQLMGPLEALGIQDADPVPRILLPLSECSSSVQELGNWCRDHKVLAAHPGSGSPSKNWPEPSWHEWTRRFVERSERGLLLIGGEAEGDRLTRLTAGLPRSRWRCAQELGLADLGAVIGCCSGFLGHDSGITHLAAAVGKPVIVMWGPTVWEVWHPSGDIVKVLRSRDALSALGISEVETCLAGIGF